MYTFLPSLLPLLSTEFQSVLNKLFFLNSKPNMVYLQALVSMSYSAVSLIQNELILPTIWPVYTGRKNRTTHINRPTCWDHCIVSKDYGFPIILQPY